MIFAGFDDNHDDGIMSSNDAGATWTANPQPVNTMTNCIASIGSYVIAGNNGSIMRSSDNGQSWEITSTAIGTPFAVNILVHRSVVLIGIVGRGIFRSLDSGATWQPANRGIDDTVISTYSMTADSGFVFIGADGAVSAYRSNDDGGHWAPLLSDTVCYQCLMSSNGSELFAIRSGGSDTMIVSRDEGMTWSRTSDIFSSSGFSSRWSSILALGQNVFLSSTDAVGAVLLSRNAGGDWSWVGQMHRVNSIFVYDNYILAGTNNTGVYRAALSDLGVDAVPVLPAEVVISLIPNPASDHVDISTNGIRSAEDLVVTDALGREIESYHLPPGTTSHHLDVHSYASGVYSTRIGTQVVRFVKL